MRWMALLCFVSTASAAEPGWKDFAPLFGEWEGDPSADGATGSFTLAPDLDGKVVVRKNRADYPATKDRPAIHHTDLMVMYREGEATRAEYWDSEGHLVRYSVTGDGASYTFLSDVVAGQPRFRLSYKLAGARAMTLRFEVAPDGATFKPYIEAKLHKKG